MAKFYCSYYKHATSMLIQKKMHLEHQEKDLGFRYCVFALLIFQNDSRDTVSLKRKRKFLEI